MQALKIQDLLLMYFLMRVLDQCRSSMIAIQTCEPAADVPTGITASRVKIL